MLVNAHNIIQHESMADAFPDSTDDDQVLLLQKDFQFQQPMATIPTIKMPMPTQQVQAVANRSGEETHATVRPTLTQNQVVRASSVKQTKKFDDYAYLGDYKCCTKDKCEDPTYSWGWENEDECKTKCDNDQLCYGYSHSGSSCLNWLEESLKNGGEKWDDAGCHLKMSAYTTAYGYAHEGAKSCRNKNGEVPSAISKTLHLYECSHECANSETCYGFSWSNGTEQCDLWQEVIKDAEGTSSSHCWKKPFFKPDLDMGYTETAFEAAKGNKADLPSFATLQKYVLRAGIVSLKEFSFFVANMMQESDKLTTTTEAEDHYNSSSYDYAGGDDCDKTCDADENVAEGTSCCGSDCKTKCNNHYIGRGYLQTTWRWNYQNASDYGHCKEDSKGKAVDIVDDPDKVATDSVVSWCTSAFFWKKNVHDDRCQDGCDLGNTIAAINGDQECEAGAEFTEKHREAAQNRWCYFAAFYDSYTKSKGGAEWADDDDVCIKDLALKRECGGEICHYQDGNWVYPDPVCCKCKTPGEGTSGKNEYECTDGYSAYCASNEECYNTATWNKGSWDEGCTETRRRRGR